MPYVSKDQYKNACGVDLAAWLLVHHPEAVQHKYGAVTLRSDSHVSVKDGFHGFLDFRTGEKGNNVDFLMRYLGYDYPGAVMALLDLSASDVIVPVCNSAIGSGSSVAAPMSKEIALPAAAESYRNVFAYLMSRGIPSDVIQMLVDRKVLYQSAKGNNAVFVSPQGDYLELRGNNSYADRRCRERTECSDYTAGDHQWCSCMALCPRYRKDPFHGCMKTRSDRFWYFTVGSSPYTAVYICEAAIDAVSLYVLHMRHDKTKTEPAVYVSIGGVANQQTVERIKRQHTGVVIATDNDAAGDGCRARNSELKTIRPVGKDWNEDLQKGQYYGG